MWKAIICVVAIGLLIMAFLPENNRYDGIND